MPPGVKVTETDLAVYTPSGSRAIVGIIGPATKGAVDVLGEFADEGNFVNAFGRPVDYQHAVRAAIRYLRFGNQLRFVRIAGPSLQNAYVEQLKNVSGTEIAIIKFLAASPGTWANGELKVNIIHNGSPATSYDLQVIFRGQTVEQFQGLTNSNVETTVNNNSSYITVELHPSAGTTFPDSTLDTDIEVYVPLVLAEGDDGAFASSKHAVSSTGGVSAETNWAYTIPFNGTTDYSNNEGRPIAPGTFVASTSAPAESFSDNGEGVLTGSAGGTGQIDYKTGSWSLSFNGAPTADVSVNYGSGTLDFLGDADSSVANYSGIVSRPGVAPSYITLYDPRSDQVELGDGATAAYAPTLGTDIVPGTVQITALDVNNNLMTVTDDGAGGLVGNVTAPGTINYQTGAASWTFDANVKNGAAITAIYTIFLVDNGSGVLSGDSVAGTINYQTGAWTLVHTFVPAGNFIPGLETGGDIEAVYRHVDVLGFGDGSEVDFSGTLVEAPVKPNTISVEFGGGSPLTDDGIGNLTGVGGSGTIDYFTGEVSVTLTGAPASGVPVYVLSDPIVLNFTSLLAGPIGNERDTLEDGLFVWVDKSANSPTSPYGQQWYRVRVFFNDGSGSSAIETFDNLTSITKLIETINDTNTGSQHVRAESTGFLGELDVTGVGQKIGMDGAFSNNDVIGAKVGPTYSGLQLFSDPSAVPLHFISAPGIYHRQVQAAGDVLCAGRRCTWIFSIPDFEDILDARDFTNGEYNAATPGGVAVPTAKVPYPPLSAVDSSYSFASFSWLYYYDQYEDKEVYEPGEGDILALIAKVDQDSEPWYPIAGIRRGQITNIVTVRYSPNDGEREATYGLSGTRIEVINPFLRFVGQGIFLYGQRTMKRDTGAIDRLHVRWTVNIIANDLLVAGRSYPFELNDEILWRQVQARVVSILSPIAARRGIVDYRVLCDATTNTPETISQKKLIAKVFIQFTEVAEEIEFQLVFTPTTADFSEVAPLG